MADPIPGESKAQDCLSTIICAILLVVIFLLLKNCLLNKISITSKAEHLGGFVDEEDAREAVRQSEWGRVRTEVSPQLLNVMYDQRYKQYGEGRGMVYNQ
jgi:hypothetical protein